MDCENIVKAYRYIVIHIIVEHSPKFDANFSNILEDRYIPDSMNGKKSWLDMPWSICS